MCNVQSVTNTWDSPSMEGQLKMSVYSDKLFLNGKNIKHSQQTVFKQKNRKLSQKNNFVQKNRKLSHKTTQISNTLKRLYFVVV